MDVKRLPRAAAVPMWMLGVAAAHALIPFELSRLGDRRHELGRATPVARGLGLLLVTAGAAVMAWALGAHHGSRLVWAGLAIICAALPQIVRWEERRLFQRFGADYCAYLAAVPRWPGFGRSS